MPALLIKSLPVPLHRKLKEAASLHRRSMTQEALMILEDALRRAEQPADLPPPFQGSIPLTTKLINRAKRAGRP